MITPSLALFYLAATLVMAGALGVVLTRNIVYAAFALLASLLGVAGVFLLMFAEFLALVQVLIYGGAVVIVVLFSLMLTRIQDFERLTDHRQWPLAARHRHSRLRAAHRRHTDDQRPNGRTAERRTGHDGREPVHHLGDSVRGRVAGASGRADRVDCACAG